MLTIEKRNLVLKMIEEQSTVTVQELSQLLEVSEVTVRKILNELDEQGLLKRTRGGAVSITSIRDHGEKEKERRNIAEKRAIAAEAFACIQDAETIFIDAGSTTLELVRLIKNGRKRNIVVVTNALNIAHEMLDADDIELIFVGGYVRHKIMSCVGGLAEKAIENLCFDKAFLGTTSISLEAGFTTSNLYEAQVKQCVLRSTKRSFVLADSTKFGRVSMARVAYIKDIFKVISDSSLSPAVVRQIEEFGTQVTLADPCACERFGHSSVQ